MTTEHLEELLGRMENGEWIPLYPQSFPTTEELSVDGELIGVVVRVAGSEESKAKLNKAYDRRYDGFMSEYDPESSLGQSWMDIVGGLIQRGVMVLDAWMVDEFWGSLEEFAAIIGDDFDLDLEYLK